MVSLSDSNNSSGIHPDAISSSTSSDNITSIVSEIGSMLSVSIFISTGSISISNDTPSTLKYSSSILTLTGQLSSNGLYSGSDSIQQISLGSKLSSFGSGHGSYIITKLVSIE